AAGQSTGNQSRSGSGKVGQFRAHEVPALASRGTKSRHEVGVGTVEKTHIEISPKLFAHSVIVRMMHKCTSSEPDLPSPGSPLRPSTVRRAKKAVRVTASRFKQRFAAIGGERIGAKSRTDTKAFHIGEGPDFAGDRVVE